MAAMAPERSRTLHNFALPPRLNWGAQKLLRCSKTQQNDDVSISVDRKRRSSSTDLRNAAFRSPSDNDNQIEVIREKLMLDLRSEVDKMRAAILGGGCGGGGGNPQIDPPPPPDLRPWNLRTRRAACKEPPPAMDPPPPAMTTISPAPPASGGSGVGGEGARAKFAVALSRQEIEDDFVEMMGRRPPRKPKKRPRYVQKQLDTLFPGLWLSEITADMYKVNENPEPTK